MADKIPLLPSHSSPPAARQGGAGGEAKSKTFPKTFSKTFSKRKTSSADAPSSRACDKSGKSAFFSRSRSVRGSQVRQKPKVGQNRVGSLWWKGRNVVYTKGDRSRFQALREAFDSFLHFFTVLSEKFKFRTRAPASAPEEVDDTPLTSVGVDQGWQKIDDMNKSHRERVIGYTDSAIRGSKGDRDRMETYNKAHDCAKIILIRCDREKKQTLSEKNMVDLRHWFKVMCTAMEQNSQRFLHDFEVPTL